MGTLCGLFGKSKQAYYKHLRPRFSDAEVRREVLSLVAGYRQEMPCIGGLKLYHLVRAVLGDALGMGRDKFLLLMQQQGLLILPRKSWHTTCSNHIFFTYPNLAKGLIISHVNQLWVSDITYLHTARDGFCYLHLVTDAFSRMIIGYAVSATLEAKYTQQALEMAIAQAGGGNLCGTIHHSDRGVQYCCGAYVQALHDHHIRISMTEDGNPTDNALAERTNGIIKGEFIEPLPAMQDMREAAERVAHAVHTYNTLRPHRSLGMQTPAMVYYGHDSQWNTFENGRNNNTFRNGCDGNRFGNGGNSNTFGDG